MSIRNFVLAAAMFALMPTAQASEVFEQAKITAGEMLYRVECRRCHAPDSNDPSYGPPLENVIGRGAGTFPDGIAARAQFRRLERCAATDF